MNLYRHLPLPYLTWLTLVAILCLNVKFGLATPVVISDSLLSTVATNVSVVQTPVCDKTLGGLPVTRPNPSDCEAAIARISRDPRGQPVQRNFFIRESDRSLQIPNVRMPISKTVGESLEQGGRGIRNSIPND